MQIIHFNLKCAPRVVSLTTNNVTLLSSTGSFSQKIAVSGTAIPRNWQFSRSLPGLKTVDTIGMIGNCQRPVFSLGVTQHMHKITNL